VHRCITAIVAIASLSLMSATVLAAQTQTPIRKVVLAAEATKVFGAYKRVVNPVVQSGDPIHLYSEPGDFGWRSTDMARFHVVATVEIRGRNGQVTGQVTGKGEPRPLQYEGAARPENFFFSLSVKVDGRVGAYELVLRLRDVANGQTVERAFPFVLAQHRQEPRPSEPVLTSQTSKPAASSEPAKPSTTAEPAKPATATEAAKRVQCKQYFPQVGEMLVVGCAP